MDVTPRPDFTVPRMDFSLGVRRRNWLAENLACDRMNLLVTHIQLFPDDYIRSVPSKPKVIMDYDEQRPHIDAMTQRPLLVYAGHQNIPSRAFLNRAVQVNAPSPVQYPCGYLVVREYANGYYHTFMPIRSDALNDASRVSLLTGRHVNPRYWDAVYREGRGPEESNFLFASNPPEPQEHRARERARRSAPRARSRKETV